jgi:flavin-dependent dehydrogenase
MAKKEYDVIVIGSGVGGVGAAALLAKTFGKKVLVLEKSPHIGGRVASYTGKGDKVIIDGLELDDVGLRKSLVDSKCWVSYCEPDLKTIMKEGRLDGYTFENGGHGLFWGNKSRCRLLLDYLGHPVDMPVNKGLR